MNWHKYKSTYIIMSSMGKSYLVFQTHEAMSMIISKGGLGGITSDWITGISIRKSLDRERWSCKHINVSLSRQNR